MNVFEVTICCTVWCIYPAVTWLNENVQTLPVSLCGTCNELRTCRIPLRLRSLLKLFLSAELHDSES